MHIKNKRGQSTVEYILLVTAVVAVIIVFVTSNNKGGFQRQLNTTLNTVIQDMNSMAGSIGRITRSDRLLQGHWYASVYCQCKCAVRINRLKI